MSLARVPMMVSLLGFGGLIPFLGLGLAVVLGPDAWPEPVLIQAQIAYGAVITTFLGAVHWGVAMAELRAGRPAAPGGLIYSVAPSLIAWAILVLLAGGLPMVWGVAGMAVLLGLCFAADRRLLIGQGRVPDWYDSLRQTLTFGAVTGYALTIIGLGG